MTDAPAHLRIRYAYNEPAGLWAATSPDLKGLHVIDASKDRVIDRLPGVATELARAMGFAVSYRWEEPESEPVPGFRTVPEELVAAAAVA